MNLSASVCYTEKFINLDFTEQISVENWDNIPALPQCSSGSRFSKKYNINDPKLQIFSVFPRYFICVRFEEPLQQHFSESYSKGIASYKLLEAVIALGEIKRWQYVQRIL